jgi:hypothetical protein
MSNPPAFDSLGLLPPGDYELTFEELRRSLLVTGPDATHRTWDTTWRESPIGNLEVMTRQLWQVGIREVFADGSFVEEKDHPNDIDGYFVCSLVELASGELTRKLNLLDPYKIWTWDPRSRQASGLPRLSQETAPDVASLSRRALSACGRIFERHPRPAGERARISIGLSSVTPRWKTTWDYQIEIGGPS